MNRINKGKTYQQKDDLTPHLKHFNQNQGNERKEKLNEDHHILKIYN